MHRIRQTIATTPVSLCSVSLVAVALGLTGCATSGSDAERALTTPEAARDSAPLQFEPMRPTRAPAPSSARLEVAATPELSELIADVASRPGSLTTSVSSRGAIAFGAPFDCKPGHAGANEAHAASPASASAKPAATPCKGCGGTHAPGNGHDAGALARKSQNPIANLISLPFDYNANFDAGVRDNTQQILEIKPVIPQEISADFNWVHRVIVPLIDQPSFAEGSSSRSGLGDIIYQGFLSAKKPAFGKLIWGVGPALSIPTATDDVLGSDQWTLGPNFVGLMSEGPWVTGAVAGTSWTIASNDNDRPNVRQMTLQPFVNYNFGGGWYASSAPIITAKWSADKSSDTWTVPVGAGLGRVFAIGEQHINLSVRPYYNVHRPKNAARWTLEIQLTFLFPEGN
jgi:hypothetical protein